MKDDCDFGYRDSFFKQNPGKFMICSVTLQLSHIASPNLEYEPIKKFFETSERVSQEAIAQTISDIRWSKLPKPEDL
jgi:UDP-N-acetylmuramate dehydrogenase